MSLRSINQENIIYRLYESKLFILMELGRYTSIKIREEGKERYFNK